MNRHQYNISNILKEIDGSPNSVGFDISLSRTYDEIKEARFEEDDSVSFGVWERDLKKADWQKVEKLCVDALESQSKDLQIVCWLIESLVFLENFSGLAKGIEILDQFINKFWNTCYPLTEDNESDEDQKMRILDWLQNNLAKRSKLMPFIKTESGEFINLYNYEYAVDLKNTTIRDPESATNILNEAKRSNIKTLEEIQGIIDSGSGYGETLNQIENIRSLNKKLENTLATFNQETQTPFSDAIKSLEKIEKLLGSKKEPDQQESIPLPQVYKVSERDAIYDEINVLSQKLSVIEKHSPSFHVLNLVVSWKNKTLLEIIDDLKNGSSESHKLLKFLTS